MLGRHKSMNRRVGSMLTLALLLLALPMGQGELQTSFSACDGGACVSSSATYSADQEDTLKGTNTATFGGGVSLSQTVDGTGTSAENSINATSANGDTATAYYKITNPGDWHLDFLTSPGDGFESAYADVGFSVSYADKIEAGASASSFLGPFAGVNTVIDYGSVTDYVAWAQSGGFPESPYAQADQQFASASGENIQAGGLSSTLPPLEAAKNVWYNSKPGDSGSAKANTNAYQNIFNGVSNSDATGKNDAVAATPDKASNSAHSSVQIENGGLGFFSSYASASTTTADVSRNINNAFGDRIVFGAAAFNAMDSVKTRVTMDGVLGGTALLGASEATVHAYATSAEVSNTVSNANAANIVAGSGVNADSDPDAKTWDFQAASGVTVTQGSLDTSWSPSSFWAGAYRNGDVFGDMAGTGMDFTASGAVIDAMAASKNSAGQSSYAMTNILDGNIGMYGSSALADPQFTGASNYVGDAMGGSIVSNVGSNIQSDFAQGGIGSGITVKNEIPVAVSGQTTGEYGEPLPGIIEIPVDDTPSDPPQPDPIPSPKPPVFLSSEGGTATNPDGSLGTDFGVSYAIGEYISSGWRAANGEVGTPCLAATSGIDAYGATDTQAIFSGNHNGYYNPQGIFGGNSYISLANGGSIYFGGSADNLRGDHANSGGSVISGSIRELRSDAESSSGNVYSSIYGSTLEGQQVDLGWMAGNREGDTAFGHTGAIGSPSEESPANINSYSSYAIANSLTAYGSESLIGSGSSVETDWSARSRDGEFVGGSITANSLDGYMARLSGIKGARASQRSVSAWQQGQLENGQSGFMAVGQEVNAYWTAIDKRGDKIEGSAALLNNDFNFQSQQSATPFTVDASTDWSASVSVDWLPPVLAMSTQPTSEFEMTWVGTDKKMDQAGVSVYSRDANMWGSNRISSRTDSASVSSSVNGWADPEVEGSIVSFGLDLQNKKGAIVSQGANVQSGTLKASNNGKSTTTVVEGSEDVIGDGNTDINWMSQNKEGDNAQGRTLINNGYVEASNTVKATSSSVEGSEQIEFDAADFTSTSSAGTARTETHLNSLEVMAAKSELPGGTYAKYSTNSKGTLAAATSSQTVSDSQGSLAMGGSATVSTSAPLDKKSKSAVLANGPNYYQYATSGANVIDGSSVSSASSFTSNVNGATASQMVESEEQFGSILTEAISGKGYIVRPNTENPNEFYTSELNAASGARVDNGASFTSTVNSKATWSSGLLTATASQDITATGDAIEKWSGAFYAFDFTKNKFAGSALSTASITEGTINAIDSATGKTGSASVIASKFDVLGNNIERKYSAQSAVGELWMSTKVEQGANSAPATLKDYSYSVTSTPAKLSLAGKWSATGANIYKDGKAWYTGSLGKSVSLHWHNSISGIKDAALVQPKKNTIS
jgi:hypothetical protein